MKAAGLALIALISIGLAWLLLRARRLRQRHRAFARAPLPPLAEQGERLFESERALYHGTRFADGEALLAPRWKEACVADLFCTAEALFLRREAQGAAAGELLWIPLAWVDEVSLHRAFAPLAQKDLPMLSLRWRRGGERLLTELSLRGGMAQLERLRRELHLRQDRGEVLVQLGKFTQRPIP